MDPARRRRGRRTALLGVLPALLVACGTPGPVPDRPGPPVPTAAPAPVPARLPADDLPMGGLHADGNQLRNGSGRVVRLLGVNHSGTEYACVGGNGPTATGYAVFEPADFGQQPEHLAAITGWGANAIRIGLNEDCWLGSPGTDPAYAGPAYRAAVQRFVEAAVATGLAVVHELHWSSPGDGPGLVAHGQLPMPDRDRSVPFWRQVAATFRTSTSVVLDLFNEPFLVGDRHDAAAWRCWRDGSGCRGALYTDPATGRTPEYPVAGMQQLVDAVRGAGAGNLVLVGGLRYANDLSGWQRYAPVDPLHNLAASWHVYPHNACVSVACWDDQVAPLAARVPVVVGEIGAADCTDTSAEVLMTWLDAHALGYLAWTWNTWGCGGLQLMTDYRGGSPTQYGRAVRRHLLAARAAAPGAAAPGAASPAPGTGAGTAARTGQ